MPIKQIDASSWEEVIPLFNQYRIFYKQPSDPDAVSRFLKERILKNQSVVFIAYDEQDNRQQPAGFVQLYPSFSSVRLKQDWILNDLFVDENFRKRGIGEALMQEAVDFAHSQGATSIRLETAADNHVAQRLYMSMDFQQQECDQTFLTFKRPF